MTPPLGWCIVRLGRVRHYWTHAGAEPLCGVSLSRAAERGPAAPSRSACPACVEGLERHEYIEKMLGAA